VLGLSEGELRIRIVAAGEQDVGHQLGIVVQSISAAVPLALSGCRVGWRHGIASDPVRMHAWIEVDGQPVGEPPSTSRYTPLIRLP
jgi:hypothetical protein